MNINLCVSTWGMTVVRYLVKGLLIALSVLVGVEAWAIPGIVTTDNGPRFTGENRMTEEDMRIKIKGGYFRIERSWTENGWEWNRRLGDLEFFEIVNPGRDCGSPSEFTGATTQSSGDGGLCTPVDDKVAVVGMARGDESYVWDVNPNYWYRCITTTGFSATSGSGGGGMADPSNLASVDCKKKRFSGRGDKEFTTQDGSSYRWKDREGNVIFYNSDGVAQYYEDLNGNRVTINHYPDGKVSNIADPNGFIIATFHYEHPTFKNAITRISDYTGREVVYTYQPGTLAEGQFPLLESVKDVREQTWTYEYTNRVLSARIDPEANRTDFSFSQTGAMAGYKNADGVGTTYNINYDNATEEFVERVTQTDGAVIETWTNKLGHVTRKDINGETQFTALYIMSDGTDGVSEANEGRTAGAKFGKASFKLKTTHKSGGNKTSIGARMPSFEEKEPAWLRTKILTDRWGQITKTTFDRFSNIVKVEHPGGSIETWKYLDNFDFVTEYRDVKGIVQKFDYYPNGDLQTQTVALGTQDESITSYTYWPDGEVKTVTYHGDANPDNLTEEAIYQSYYDEFGNLTKSVDPYLNEVKYQDYDVNGNARTVVDQRLKVWLYEFDAVGNRTKQTSPLNLVKSDSYDKAGRYYQHTSANTTKTGIETNASGLPLKITDKLGHSLSMTYDKANRLKTVTDANNNQSTIKYDSFGRVFQAIDGEKNVSEFAYKNGLPEKATHPTYTENYDYDNRMRLRSVTKTAGALSQQRKWAYNNAHEPTHHADGEENQTISYYDALGRVERVLDANQKETIYGYDDRGNLLYVEDPEHRRTKFAYNALNQLVREELPLGQSRNYQYWENGLIKLIMHGDGRISYMAYDDDSRLEDTFQYNSIEQYQADNDRTQAIKHIHFTYNAMGAIQTYSDGATSAVYGYNDFGLLETVSVNYGPFTKSHRYTYYPNRQIKTYTNPEDVTYTYQYNGNGQITSIDIPGEGQVSYNHYLWMSADRKTLPGGGRIDQDPDGMMRFHSIRMYDPASNNVFDALYEYDRENNITGVAGGNGDESYGYDNLNRLVSASQTNGNESFLYDGVGNRIAHNGTDENWVYTENNELESRPGVTYEYNENGHLSKRTEGSTVTDFIYNHEERLVEVRQNGSSFVRYYYDPFGRRLWKEVGGSRTYYYYNQSGLVAEYDVAGNLKQEYHYTPGKPWGADPVFTRTDGKLYYYLTDHRFAPCKLMDKTGKVVWSAKYSAFGQAAVSVNIVNNPLRLAGQYFDDETGLHYNYMRYYDPATGRYIQRDPIGLGGGINPYAYANLNPLTMIDPLGLFAGDVDLSEAAQIFAEAAVVGAVIAGVIAAGVAAGIIGPVILTGIAIASVINLAVLGYDIYQQIQNGCFTNQDLANLLAGLAGGLFGGGLGATAGKSFGSRYAPEGIVYRRTDPITGEVYFGQAMSPSRFAARKSEHDNKLGVQHNYEIVGRAKPGKDLDIAEHSAIQKATGGVRAKDSPLVANKKDPVGPARRKLHGLPEPKRL